LVDRITPACGGDPPSPRGAAARGALRRGGLLCALLVLISACRGEAPEVANGTAAPPVTEASTGDPVHPRTVEDIFPATATRNMFLNRCSSCHSPACAALGQRDIQRWREVEASHVSYNPGMSAEDRGRVFDYLRRHFNENTPEPFVPAELLEGGCPTLPPQPQP
jgi:hypothetical protein